MTTKVVVRHFHEGNDAGKFTRGTALYATHVRIIDLNKGEVVEAVPIGSILSRPCEVWVYCNPKDVPSRSQGREIAFGRLKKRFPEQCAQASWGVLKQ